MIKEYIYIFLIIYFPFFIIWAFYFRGLPNLYNLSRKTETELNSYSKYQRKIFCVICNKDTLHASDWLDGFKLFLVTCGCSFMFLLLSYAFYQNFVEKPPTLDEILQQIFSINAETQRNAWLQHKYYMENQFRYDVIFVLIIYAILTTVLMYIFKIIRHFIDNKICTICNPEALSYKSKWKEINRNYNYKQIIPGILFSLGIVSFVIYLFYLWMWLIFNWSLDQFLQEFLWFLY